MTNPNIRRTHTHAHISLQQLRAAAVALTDDEIAEAWEHFFAALN